MQKPRNPRYITIGFVYRINLQASPVVCSPVQKQCRKQSLRYAGRSKVASEI